MVCDRWAATCLALDGVSLPFSNTTKICLQIMPQVGQGAVPAKLNTRPLGCPWIEEIGQLMVECRDDVPFEIPACPEDCGNKKCRIRHRKKKK